MGNESAETLLRNLKAFQEIEPGWLGDKLVERGRENFERLVAEGQDHKVAALVNELSEVTDGHTWGEVWASLYLFLASTVVTYVQPDPLERLADVLRDVLKDVVKNIVPEQGSILKITNMSGAIVLNRQATKEERKAIEGWVNTEAQRLNTEGIPCDKQHLADFKARFLAYVKSTLGEEAILRVMD